MLDVALMISSGADTNKFRDIAVRAAADVTHLFTYELDQPAVIREWDYRRDNPRVVPADSFAARSLSMVERSECVLAIFGPTVPDTTAKEITRAFERRQAGQDIAFWLFLNPDQKTRDHIQFIDAITARFGEKIVYCGYRTELEFQSHVMTTLIAYVARQLRMRPVLGGGGGR